MRLYKFRSLGDETSLEWACSILRTGEFRCSRFWDMNDPMEGIFRFEPGIPAGVLDELFWEKNHRVLCSFSADRAFKLPTMWGYYANGFKGIAIEIEVDPSHVQKVRYSPNVAKYVSSGGRAKRETMLKRILTTKLASWKSEDEYRFIAEADGNCFKQIGEIKAVHFGWPHRDVINRRVIAENSDSLAGYQDRLPRLLKVARNKGFACHEVKTVGNKVQSQLYEG